MPTSPTQANRLLGITTSLGPDVLLVKSVQFRDRLGSLFHLDAELLSEGADVNFDQIVGTNATVRITQPNGKSRFFNGYVNQFALVEVERGFAHYRATLVPWLWFLTQTSDCRIFQKQKVPDIIEAVFKSHGFSGYKTQLTATYLECEYCVQYRETDFNFVSRLMEREGIYYYFTHENGAHTLVLADSASAHATTEGYETIPFKSRTQVSEEWSETITQWALSKTVRPGVATLADFDFKNPAAAIVTNASVRRDHEASGFEMYDYPGSYAQRDAGENYAKLRIQELQAQHETLSAETTARGMATGRKFSLSQHYRADQNRAYLITSTLLQATAGLFSSGDATAEDFFCGQFTAIPFSTPFRPSSTTPRPVVQGPQTAIVVGKAGEEIDTDEFGRVKVHFHWDRFGKADENSSCWIRVAHAAAGKGWGAISIPRIGQEVVVDFLEGNPDQPIITGRMYNATAKVPFPLPQHKTISTFKSSSSKGGDGFNEIRFEDQKGEEQIYIHGEKNMDIRVKNDTYETVGHDRHLEVENNLYETVKTDRHDRVLRDHREEVLRDHHCTVHGKEALQVKGSHSFRVKSNVSEIFEENQSTIVSEDLYIRAKNIAIEAHNNLTLSVGNSYIVIEDGGIKISTTGEIVIEASRSITQGAGTTAEIKSPMTTVKGSSLLSLEGGLVKIN